MKIKTKTTTVGTNNKFGFKKTLKIKISIILKKLLGNNRNFLLFAYLFNVVIKNKFFLAMLASSLLAAILTNVFLIDPQATKVSLMRWSLYIYIIPFVSSMILATFAGIILFSGTVTNNIDSEMMFKGYSKTRLLVMKQLILAIIFGFQLVTIIILKLVWVGRGIDFKLTGLMFMIEVGSLLLLMIIYIPILTFFANLVVNKNVNNGLSIILVAIFATLTFILPLIMSSTNQGSYEAQRVKEVLYLSQDGTVVNNKLTYEDTTSEPFDVKKDEYQNLPFFIGAPLLPRMLNSAIDLSEDERLNLYKLNPKSSTSFFNLQQSGLRDNFENDAEINHSQTNMIVVSPYSKSIFSYENKSQLFDALLQELMNDPTIGQLVSGVHRLQKLNIDKDVNEIKNDISVATSKLSQSVYWNKEDIVNILGKKIYNNISIKNVIEELLGLFKTNSLMYDLYENYHLVDARYNIDDKQKGSMQQFLSQHLFPELSIMVNFLVNSNHPSNNNVRWNIYNPINKDKATIFQKDEKTAADYHSNLLKIDYFSRLNPIDVNYLQNYYFAFNYDLNGNVTSIGYRALANAQDQKDKLKIIDEKKWSSIFQGIVFDKNNKLNKTEVDTYFNNLTPGVLIGDSNNKSTLYQRLATISSNGEPPMSIYLHGNVPNYASLNSMVDVKSSNRNSIDYIYLFILAIIALGMQLYVLNKIKHKDVL